MYYCPGTAPKKGEKTNLLREVGVKKKKQVRWLPKLEVNKKKAPRYVIGGPAAPQTPLLSWGALPPRPPVLNSFEYEACRTCCLEVCTIFGAEPAGSVYYFRD